MQENILAGAQALAPWLSQCRRWLHAHPGTGFDTADAREFVRQQLLDMGISPADCGKSGLTALIGTDGPTFLLRADMDALPIAEESGEPFASDNGNMHACGHDLHTAMLLGAAKLLKAREESLHGRVKLMFQSAEEVFLGAKDMIDSGILADPPVEAALMIHVTTGTLIPTGTVLISAPGVSAPAADYFTIRVYGHGCHGSSPQKGVDAITAAAHILIALQELHARELAPSLEAVLTVGTIHGGSADNAIADTVTMGGTIRTYDVNTRAFLKHRLEEMAMGIAAAFRAKAYVEFGSGCPPLVNDKALSLAAQRYLPALLGPERVIDLSQQPGSTRGGGSEDFAYISHQVPSLMLALAAGEPDRGYIYPQHHPRVQFDESVLPLGAAVLADFAEQWLQELP